MTSTLKAGLGIGALASFGAAVAVALALAVSANAAPAKLIGTVGPGETISLKTASGKRIATLPRGTYSITVRDRSDEHNFALTGAGVRKTVTVRLGSGQVTFVCVPHADDMRGRFKVR